MPNPVGRPKNVETYLKTNEMSFSSPERQSPGILDDFAVRKNLDTQEGTIQKVPVNPKDIVNKAYADSLVPATSIQTTLNVSGASVISGAIILASGAHIVLTQTGQQIKIGTDISGELAISGASIKQFINDATYAVSGASIKQFVNDYTYAVSGASVKQFLNDAIYAVSGASIKQFVNDATYAVSGASIKQFVNDATFCVSGASINQNAVSGATLAGHVVAYAHPAGVSISNATLVNVCYGTGATAPAGLVEGAIYLQYTP